MKFKSDTYFKAVRLLAGILSLLFLSGCASWFYTPGMSELEELCEKDGGVQIFETVEVDGYFNGDLKGCWGCWDEIISSGFEFFELKVRGGTGLDVFNHDEGYWRLEKVDRSSGQCHVGIDEMLMRQKDSSDMKKFIKDYCIAAEKVDKPKSQYGFFLKKNEWVVSDYYGSTILKRLYSVRDLASQEIIAQKIDYLLNPFPKGFDYGKVLYCHDVGVMTQKQGNVSFLLRTTIKTKK